MGSYIEAYRDSVDLKHFDFNNESRVFTLGNHVLQLDQDLLTAPITSIVLEEPRTNDIDITPVCLNQFGNPIGSRIFHDWLAGLREKDELIQVKQSTLDVMESTLRTLDSVEIPEVLEPGHVSFNFNLDKDSHIKLHTFGDCACLGPFPEGSWVNSSDWDAEGLCEYTFHNIWSETQRWSLLAGLGHIARLAAQEQN